MSEPFTGATGSMGSTPRPTSSALPHRRNSMDELSPASEFEKHQLEVGERAMERSSVEAGNRTPDSDVHVSDRTKRVMDDIAERAALEREMYPKSLMQAQESYAPHKQNRVVSFLKKLFGSITPQ